MAVSTGSVRRMAAEEDVVFCAAAVIVAAALAAPAHPSSRCHGNHVGSMPGNKMQIEIAWQLNSLR